MKAGQQIPRNALVWSVLTLFALVAPHIARIPIWVLAVYVFAAFWRIMVYRGRWSFPGRWVKVLFILSSFIGLYLSYGTFLGLEPTVALLLTAFALKLIELAERKDAYVLLFLGYFVCVTEFLFSQDLLIVFYSMFTVTLITTALLALHQPEQNKFNPRTIRQASVMLLQAFPLMLVLFFLFPRIGPLWTVPLKSHAAKTGVSDFMRPGDISNLSQSADVAFRVQFEGDIPSTSDLYWRGLVFSKLADGAWTSLRYFEIPAERRRQIEPELVGGELNYSIIMESTQQNWLYSLRYAKSTQRKIMDSADYRLYSPVILEDEYQYSVRSWPDVQLENELSDWRREIELVLPAGENPQTYAYAKQLRQDSDSDRSFVDAVLKKFNTEQYIYTLQPPLLGANAMDQFLFQTQRGFCEHYAYAFVVMMRAAGVPSRVIAGYQGGEVNPVNKTVIVHQFDAHAWAEVWLEGEGWVRVDPTAAVSPDRIEWGLERAVAQEGSFLSNSPLSPLRYRSVIWINNMRLRYDALTWRWQKWIVGYDSKTQYEFLQNWLGEINSRKFAMVLLGSWALVLIPVGLLLLAKRDIKRSTPMDKQYLAFCSLLEKRGVVRAVGEAPGDFAARAGRALPELEADIKEVTRLYSGMAYAEGPWGQENESSAFNELKTAVRHFRR
jgi:transglutaminase-like putative cysteine protease